MNAETACALGAGCVFLTAIMFACVLCQWANRLQGRLEQRWIDAREYRRDPRAFEARVVRDALMQARAECGAEEIARQETKDSTEDMNQIDRGRIADGTHRADHLSSKATRKAEDAFNRTQVTHGVEDRHD
ncbi:MAG TPA: hypothetical protein VNB29_09195 [Chthoniobacterales bacterium]|nr:hypothetical protein [Chthoniobacterales bacterium]